MKLRPIPKPQQKTKTSKRRRKIAKNNLQTPVKTPFKFNWKHVGLPVAIASSVWLSLFLGGMITLGGVPASVLGIFLKDPTSITAFVVRDNKHLHSRLQELKVEKVMKAYYRPQIPDEIILDQYIHQIFYNWTGYIGANYEVTPDGKLILTESGFQELLRELER
ncbi:MAG: hypothetical protein EA365_12945 [Gloeocapsa sp. DLM2.Bin57]|nr:MAG: hypothetical protein EA365_12945 [Gloeocapsa sp. DLM2.Bin57]